MESSVFAAMCKMSGLKGTALWEQPHTTDCNVSPLTLVPCCVFRSGCGLCDFAESPEGGSVEHLPRCPPRLPATSSDSGRLLHQEETRGLQLRETVHICNVFQITSHSFNNTWIMNDTRLRRHRCQWTNLFNKIFIMLFRLHYMICVATASSVTSVRLDLCSGNFRPTLLPRQPLWHVQSLMNVVEDGGKTLKTCWRESSYEETYAVF